MSKASLRYAAYICALWWASSTTVWLLSNNDSYAWTSLICALAAVAFSLTAVHSPAKTDTSKDRK